MSRRNPLLPILLAVALVAQAVIAGWGHSHAHLVDCAHSDLGGEGQLHHLRATAGHSYVHSSHEHSPLPKGPTDKEDCSICRHLALAAIVALDLEALSIGDAAEPVQSGESALVSTIAIGLRRPRSPPELS